MRRPCALSELDKKHLERRLALEEKVRKQGLAGQKLGKHEVPQDEVQVKLGEDLSESLRGLKVILFDILLFPRVDVFSF
jgi:nucleolar protein 53